MAPFMGPTKEALLEHLAGWRPKLPITLGLYEPQAVVDRRRGRWVLVPLVMNHAKANTAGERALANGEPWMPEMTWQFLEEGPPLIDEPDKDAFIAAIRTMKYPYAAR